MGDPKDPKEPSPFRLEGEEAPAAAPTPAPAPPPSPAPIPPRFEGTDAPAAVPRVDESRHEVSSQTVREKHGESEKRPAGPMPPPRGWPAEALLYPLRRFALPLVFATALFALADWGSAYNAFLGGLAKVFLYVILFLWTVKAVATTATGKDRPPGLTSVTNLDPDGLAGFVQFLVTLLLYLAPAFVAFIRPVLVNPGDPLYDGPTWFWIWFLLGIGLLAAPVIVMGHALSYRRLAWPWRAVFWILRGLPTCLLVTLSWAACAGVEWAVSVNRLTEPGKALPLYGAYRLATMYLVFVGARSLGVLGRRVSF